MIIEERYPEHLRGLKPETIIVIYSLRLLKCMSTDTRALLPYYFHNVSSCITVESGSGSSVGIATELRAGHSGIEFRWGRVFPSVQTDPAAHPASCKMGTGYFLGVKCGRGVLLTTHPLLVPRSWKSRAIPLPTFWATPGL